MNIAVSCLHCPEATISMTFQINICEQHMHIRIYQHSLISPIAVEIPLPFIVFGQYVLVLTDPDQLGVKGFV